MLTIAKTHSYCDLLMVSITVLAGLMNLLKLWFPEANLPTS